MTSLVLAAQVAPRVSPLWKLALATVALAGVVALLWWGRKMLLARINHYAVAGTKRISSLKLRLLGLQQIMQLARMGVRLLSVGLVLIAFLFWLTFLPSILPETESWAGRLEHAIADELGVIGAALLGALPGIGVILILFFVTRIVHEFLNHYFRSIEEGEVESEIFDVVTAETTRRLAGFALWTCATIIAYPYIPGSNSPVFQGVSILAGLMVSLGGSSLVGQLISGLVLIYTRTLRPGDSVAIGDVEGKVEHVGLFSCRIRTPDEVLVTLPNATVAAGVRSFSRATPGSAVRFVTTITIGYDTPWQQVHALLLEAARGTSEIRRDPEPWVRQAALEDFYVRYELVFAPSDPSRRRLVLSRLHESIQERFHGAGVQIMSPNYESDPAQPKIPARRPESSATTPESPPKSK